MLRNNGLTRRTPGAKYQPAHGRDFDVSLEQLDAYTTSRTRDRVGYIVLGASLGATGVAAVYGFASGDFGGLRDVWAVAGPIVGGIVGYYFHRTGRKDTG